MTKLAVAFAGFAAVCAAFLCLTDDPDGCRKGWW